MPKRRSRRSIGLRSLRTMDYVPSWQLKRMHALFALYHKYQEDLETVPLHKGEHVIAYIPGEIERAYKPVVVHDKGDNDCWIVYDEHGMIWSVDSAFLYRNDDMPAEVAATISFALGTHQDGVQDTKRDISYAFDKWKMCLELKGCGPIYEEVYVWMEFFLLHNRMLRQHLIDNEPSMSYPTTF